MTPTTARSRKAPANRPKAAECPLADVLADRLRVAKRELAMRWLERIADRVSLDANQIFPTNELLDHVPLLIEGIADYLESPVNEVSIDIPVVAKARELGALRHSQGFDAYQILKEYEILGGILFAHLAEAADGIAEPCAKSELLYCGQRLFRAVTLIQQTTTVHFLQLSDERISEREDRLRAFNRAVSHEIKNRIGTILGASVSLLEMPDIEPAQHKRFITIIARNARDMRHTVENLIALSRMEKEARQHRNVLLQQAAQEAVRQVREAADGANVTIALGSLPGVEVNAAAVELCLTNYLSNAIKYALPGQDDRHVEVTGEVTSDPTGSSEIVIRVADNGAGVPEGHRENLFQRFFRAHEATITGAEGTGLGLNIVRETIESLGGRAWAEFPHVGSIFAFSLPYRRGSDDAGDADGAKPSDTGAAVTAE
jgi:signal transduction histidine kinase